MIRTVFLNFREIEVKFRIIASWKKVEGDFKDVIRSPEVCDLYVVLQQSIIIFLQSILPWTDSSDIYLTTIYYNTVHFEHNLSFFDFLHFFCRAAFFKTSIIKQDSPDHVKHWTFTTNETQGNQTIHRGHRPEIPGILPRISPVKELRMSLF